MELSQMQLVLLNLPTRIGYIQKICEEVAIYNSFQNFNGYGWRLCLDALLKEEPSKNASISLNTVKA
jgi:hypothetical protein